MKKFVKLGLSERTVESLITLGNNVYTGMNGNAQFPDPPVDMADLSSAVANLSVIHAECVLTRSIASFSQERDQVAIVETMLRTLGDFVDIKAQGSGTVIMDAGMPVSKTREKQPVPEQITDITAKYTGIPGTVQLAWKRPQFSKLFRVYMSTDPVNESGWQLLDTITTRKMLVQNLASKQRYFFQVVPVGTAGAGEASAPVNSIAA